MSENYLDLNNLFFEKKPLLGKVIVVTGASSGLGKAITLGLISSGAKVALIDISEKTTSFAEKINSDEEKEVALPIICSVTDEAQLEKAYSDITKRFSQIDGLINCAGIARLGAIDSLLPKDIKFSNEININGYFLNALFASKQMIKQKSGSIINISSASARGASENSSLYGVAKEAQCMMTRSWALDLGKYNIRVNAVLAGDLFGNEEIGVLSGIWNKEYFEKKAIDKGLISKTDSRLEKDVLDPEIRQLVINHYVKRTALAKEIEYKDVLSLIIFLLLDELSGKVTGESIAVTSGNPTVFSK